MSAMENAGAKEIPEDAERKGLGTPATRAAILEKLVAVGFAERKKKQLIPTKKGINLVTVLPDNIKSPALTAEWESMLKQVEHGEITAATFMEGIAGMSRELVRNYNMLDGRLDNEPPERPDLTDGQTWEEIRELAPETLPEETAKKPSLMERLKGERPEQGERQAAPSSPERER